MNKWLTTNKPKCDPQNLCSPTIGLEMHENIHCEHDGFSITLTNIHCEHDGFSITLTNIHCEHDSFSITLTSRNQQSGEAILN